jgi:tripartite-type tricarboxylate transporter receptor subunit TctC
MGRPTPSAKRLALYAVGALAILLIAMAIPRRTQAPDYPDPRREVRHIIPWPAGGGTDAAMRGFMQYFEEHLGIPVVTENISGGLSSVGLLTVRRTPPDGYTIGTMTYDVLTVGFLGLAPLDWTDFEPICAVTEHPTALIVRAEDYADLESFRADAQARPEAIRIGNNGTQGIWHQHAVALAREMGIRLHHVPYEGSSGLLSALLGGEVEAVASSLPAFLPYIQEGTLRALAVMSTERNVLVREAPTFAEHGYELEFGGFRVLIAPIGTSENLLSHLEGVCRAAWDDPGFQEWARNAAIGPVWRDRAETQAYLRVLVPRVGRLMEDLGMH